LVFGGTGFKIFSAGGLFGSGYAIGPLVIRSIKAICQRGAKAVSPGWWICLLTLIALPAIAASSVPLAWNASSDANVAGYKIYYGVASRAYTNSVDVGNVTNTVIDGLVAGATYYFAATTYDAAGVESDFSNEAMYLVNPSVVPPPPVYLPPTLNALGNVSINENAAQQTVSLTGIGLGSGQTLTIAAVSSNPALIPAPAVSYTSPNASGSLAFTSAANYYGTAVITVTANNGQPSNNIVTQTFTVTVAPVYQPPTLSTLGNLSLNENSGAQTVNFSGVTLGSGQTLTVTASSSNPALISNPAVNYTSPNASGSLAFTPAANNYGTAVITVTANNGQPSNNIVMQTFTVTVAAVNQTPTLNSLANLTLSYNSPAQTVGLSGIGSGAANEFQAITVKAVSSNPKLISNPSVSYSSPLATGSLTLKPAANASGSTTITVTVNDGGASNNIVTRTFTVTVNPKNFIYSPMVSKQPQSQLVLVGKSATFSVAASGSGLLKYQWKYNGKNVIGGTTASLSVKNCSAKQAGLYTVTVSNTGGTVASAPAALVIATTPAATLTSAVQANGQFAFNVEGVTGYKYAVQASTDLVHWTSVQTNTAPYSFTDTHASQVARQFYRTVYVP
jgi:hypothetical protein